MPDFMAPAQVMQNQLHGIIASAAQSASNERANIADQALQQQMMVKKMEMDFDLSAKLFPVNKELALQAFNDALKPMGRQVTMENFDVSKAIFDQAAEFKRNGDTQGMQMLLDSSQKYLINIADQAKAIGLRQEASQARADQQAKAVADLQPQTPQLQQAKELVNQYPAYLQGQLRPEEVTRLTGTDDPDGQRRVFMASQAVIEGEDQKTKNAAALYRQYPAAFEKAAEGTAMAMVNPEARSKVRIAELLQNPERTPQQERELRAHVFTYGSPQLQAAFLDKSAIREKQELAAQLDDVGTRITDLNTNLGSYHDAEGSISQIDKSAQGLPDASGPVTDAQAKDHLLLEGTREAKRQLFQKENQPQIDSLEKMAALATQHAQELSRRAVAALPGQREKLDGQIQEFERIRTSQSAMARLLKEENPYELATREAQIAQMDDPEQQAAARESLATVQQQRTRDLALVDQEKARLLRKQSTLEALMPAADRKEKAEQQMRMAVDAAMGAIDRRMPILTAVNESARRLGVDNTKLAKEVTDLIGLRVPEAQFKVSQLDPNSPTLNSQIGKIAREYGVKATEIEGAIKNPTKAPIEVKLGESLDKEIGPIVTQSYNAALGAIDTIDAVNRAKDAIAKGAVSLGPAATIRNKIAQISQMLGTGGKDTTEQLVNTRNVMRSLAQFSLGARKQLKGQGQVSDFEGRLIVKAESGEIDDMTLPELKSFLAVTDRLARKQYAAHERTLGVMRKNPRMESVVPFYEVPDLPAAKPDYIETRKTQDGRILGKRPDGTIEEIR